MERSGRLRRACRVCGAVPWNAVAGCDDGRRACRACGVCGAVPWGLLLGVSRGRGCAVGIAGGRVAWVPLCHGDCCWACRVGGAVPWGLLTQPLSGWRRVLQKKLVGVSRGWRRVLGIADQGLVAVLVRVAAGILASQNGNFGKAALVQNRHFWVLVRVRGLGTNGSFLKAALVQNRHFWALVRVRAFERSKNGSILKAALVQNRHFSALGRVRALERPG